MCKNIKCNLHNAICDLKAILKNNKGLLLAIVCFALLGIVIALFYVIGNEYSETYSVIGAISRNTFSVPKFEIILIVALTVPALLCVLSGINHRLVYLNFITASVAFYFLFRYIFISIACDPIFGIISLIVIFFPIICINLLCFSLLLIKMFSTAMPICNKKFYITPLRFLLPGLKKAIKKYLLLCILPCCVWANVIIIIVFIFV